MRQSSSEAKGAQPHRAPFFPSHFTGFGTIPGLGWEGQQFFGNKTHLVQLSPSTEPAPGSRLCSFLRSPACFPQGQPSDKILSRQQGWSVKKPEDDSCPCPPPSQQSQNPNSICTRLRASFTHKKNSDRGLPSPQSPLTPGGWASLRTAVGPTALSLFCYSRHDARPRSPRRARMGQGHKLWYTRNGLNGGQPDSGGKHV